MGTMWCLYDPTPSGWIRLRLFQFSLRDQANNWLERLLAGSISTWEDLTTRFLAQFFPPGRTFKLQNDILMFQQHQGEPLSESWTRFKDLLQKCENDRAVGGILLDKNAKESWEIIENLALYDHEGWNDSRDFTKPVKEIYLPQDTTKTPDRRFLKLEDQISYLLKGSRTTPGTSSMHVPQAYAKRMDGKVRKAIFKQREEINDRMAEMFRLLKELTSSRTPKKVLVREEAGSPITKCVNTISRIKMKKEKGIEGNKVVNKTVIEPSKLDAVEPLESSDREEEM
ncbi:zinc finger, CCHC-type containing protein [Tanacetum coccineum]